MNAVQNSQHLAAERLQKKRDELAKATFDLLTSMDKRLHAIETAIGATPKQGERINHPTLIERLRTACEVKK